MVLLGKLLKGRSTRAPKDLRGLRVRHVRVEMQQEDLKKEEEFHKIKREHLRATLTEEQNITNFNKKKILNEWRKIMRMAKTDELKREIEIYSQNHEREVDSKDAIMQMLDRDLEEAEEQYQTALRNYMIHIEGLQELQGSRLEGLEQEFLRDLRILEGEFRLEREEIVSNFKTEQKELQDVISEVETEEKKTQDDLKSRHDTKKEASRRNEETGQLQKNLQKETDAIKRDLQIHFASYQRDSADLDKKFQEDFQKDKDNQREIEGLHKRVGRLKNSIEQLKQESTKTEKECTTRNQALNNELDTVTRHYREIKKKMLQFREEEVKRLTSLINNSRETSNKLKDQVSLGERILKYAELCRKLETEKEKVLPFYASDPGAVAEEQQLLNRDRESQSAQGEDRDSLRILDPDVAYDEFSALENFHKRYNKVLLDKLAIEKQKKQLEKDNLFFKSLLKQYLDGVSVNEDVMAAPNPLLVVNNRIQLNRAPVEAVRPVTYIEAAHVIQVRNRDH